MANDNNLKLRLTLDVEFDTQGLSQSEIINLLTNNFQHAIGNGALTGDTPAEVEEYKLDIAVNQNLEDLNLTATDVDDHLIAQAEASNMDNMEVISNWAVKFGMMQPHEFVQHIQSEMNIATSKTSQPVNPDEIESHLSRRIEDGDIDLEDIPSRMVRYGLMHPAQFAVEMQERMDNELSDGLSPS